MRIIYGILAAVAALGCAEGKAATFTVSQTGPIITAKCSDGHATPGCTWCVAKSGNCYTVKSCKDGKCEVAKLPPETTKGSTKGRGNAAAPIKTTGDQAPVATGDKPVRAVPVDVVNKSGGSSKKH